jgi:hypothetical protein
VRYQRERRNVTAIVYYDPHHPVRIALIGLLWHYRPVIRSPADHITTRHARD